MLSAVKICKGFSQRLCSYPYYSSTFPSVDRYKLHSSVQSRVLLRNPLFIVKSLHIISSGPFLLRQPHYCYLESRTKAPTFPNNFIRNYCTSMSSNANASGAGSSGSNPTPPKFSIVSFLYKLIMGLLVSLYEVPSKFISFVNHEKSNVAEIEGDIHTAAETVDKVAKVVEQAAITVEKVAEAVAEDARKTQDLMEKTESAMKKMEEATNDNNNSTDSEIFKQNSDSHATFPSKTAVVVVKKHAQLDTHNLGTKKNTTTVISEDRDATAPAAATNSSSDLPVTVSTSKGNTSCMIL